MTRKQWVLTALLGAQVLLLIFTHGPLADSMAAVAPEALFPPLSSFTPAKLEIDGSSDDDKVTLVREGDGWGLQEEDGYPADTTKVDQLLDKLKELKVRRPVVTSSRYHKALKVSSSEHERHVRIWKDAGDKPAIDFYLGTSPNYQRIHVRRADQDDVYEAEGIGAYDVQARAPSWFDANFVNVPLEQVKSVKVQNGSGSFEITKGEDGTWMAGGKALDKSKVETFVRSVASLRASEPVGKRDDASQGLTSPQATVTLRYAEPGGEMTPESEQTKEVTVIIGGAVADDENRVHIARSGFDYAAEAYKSTVDPLVTKKLSDLEGNT